MGIIVTCLPTFPSLINNLRKHPVGDSRTYVRSDERQDRKKPLHNGHFLDFMNHSLFSRESEIEQSSMDDSRHGTSYHMENVSPVHVQTDVRVRWDQEAHHTPGSIV